MSSASNPQLYNQVVRVTHVYLGPAADRFIARQVQSHLQKPPEKLSQEDLGKLIKWIRLAVSLLTDDSEIIEEYAAQLQKLAEPASTRKEGDTHAERT